MLRKISAIAGAMLSERSLCRLVNVAQGDQHLVEKLATIARASAAAAAAVKEQRQAAQPCTGCCQTCQGSRASPR